MISKSLKDTQKIAEAIAEKIQPRTAIGNVRATIIALSGDLGSGKTTFTKAFAAYFGIPEKEITSPTFVIMKSYDLEGKKFERLIHIDAYRLEKPEEIERLGWKEMIIDPGNLILIEWPENIGEALPKLVQKVSFKFIDENTREISF